MIGKTQRDYLYAWLWAMCERSNQEELKLRSAGKSGEALHFQRQIRRISNILAVMTRNEHPVTR